MKKINVVLSCAFLLAAALGADENAFGQGFGGYSAPVSPTPAPVYNANAAVRSDANSPSSVSTAPVAAAPVANADSNLAPLQAAPSTRPNAVAPAANVPAPRALVAQRTAETASRKQNPANSTNSAAPPAFAPAGTASVDAPTQGGVLADATIQSAIIPPPANYKITENEQIRLDEFLQLWENFGRDIKRISCDVHMKEFDGGLLQRDAKKPITHTWGLFRFIAPNKLQYHVKGEFSYAEEGTPAWKDGQNEWAVVLDGKSLTQYDYTNKKAVVYPIPEDEQNIDLTLDNGQFPLFFIAKAELLKNRFYMRLVTPETKRQSEVWIEAFPRYARDAQQFRSIIVLLSLKDMQPTYMRKNGVNGKSKTDLVFENVLVNRGKWEIEGKVDPSWVKDVRDEEFSLLRQQPLETSVAQSGSRPQPQTNAPTVPNFAQNAGSISVLSVEDAAKQGLARTAKSTQTAKRGAVQQSQTASNAAASRRR